MALYASSCDFKTVSFPKNGVTVGVKIPVSKCTPQTRAEYFTDRVLKVRLSMDTETGNNPPLPGMEDEYPTTDAVVKVTQHAVSSTHVSFSLRLDQADITAEFAQMISNRPGSLYVLEAMGDDGEEEETEFLEDEVDGE